MTCTDTAPSLVIPAQAGIQWPYGLDRRDRYWMTRLPSVERRLRPAPGWRAGEVVAARSLVASRASGAGIHSRRTSQDYSG